MLKLAFFRLSPYVAEPVQISKIVTIRNGSPSTNCKNEAARGP